MTTVKTQPADGGGKGGEEGVIEQEVTPGLYLRSKPTGREPGQTV